MFNSAIATAKWFPTDLLSPARLIRILLVVGYVGIVVVCFSMPWGPRLFWTIGLPLLPISIVIIGFYPWRRICPLAFWGTLGVRFKPKGGNVRRVPPWMEQWFFVIAGSFLATMLVVRLILINGDGIWLGLTLILLAGLAASANFIFTGKTWCNFFCPVGVVERIYTDPNSIRSSANSQCVKCTACKKHCPDIEQENAYWKDVTLPARRIAFFAFPGVVLGFYTYFWLRYGDWEAYFDGRWTHTAASFNLALGPGFFFAPMVPAIFAAPITLLGFALASYILFRLAEKIVGLWIEDEERKRHLTLTLAAFTAFNLFYVFAGAPTLRLVPGGTRMVAFTAPALSMLFLVKRWNRSSEDNLKEKSAKKLIAKWSFAEPPPKNPAEVFAFFKGQEQAHAAQVDAYKDAIREMLAEGVITQRELRLLSRLRQDLSVSESEHSKIFTALSEEEKSLFDPARATRVEQRLQLDGYRIALAAALERNAPAREIVALRDAYGITAEAHEALLKELRGDLGPLRDKVLKHLKAVEQIRTQLLSLTAVPEMFSATHFAIYALLKAQDRAVDRIIELLALLGDGDRVRAAARGLFAANRETQSGALAALRQATEAGLVDQLAPIILNRMPEPDLSYKGKFDWAIKTLAGSPDPFQRAGAATIIGHLQDSHFQDVLSQSLSDNHPLVRETAVYAASRAPNLASAQSLEALRNDPDENVRRAASEVIEVLEGKRGRRPLGEQIERLDELTGRGIPLPVPDQAFSTLAMIDKILFLRRIPLFVNLDPEDLYELCRLAHEQTVTTPDVLCVQGESTDDLYVLIAGQAIVTVHSNEGEQKVAVLKPGDVVGELSALDRSPRSATVRVQDGSLRVLRIGGEDFRQFLARRPDIAPSVMAIVSQRLRQALNRIATW